MSEVNGAAGAATDNAGTAAGAAQGTATPDFSFLPEAMGNLKDGFSSPEQLWAHLGQAHSLYKEREAVIGAKPASLVTDADMNKLFTALGKPQKADGYTLPEKLDGVSEDAMSIMARDSAEFKAIAHAADLTPKQAAKLYNSVAKVLSNAIAEQGAQDPMTAVKELWPTDTDRNLDYARRGAKAVGIGNDLDAAGLSGNPLVLKMAHYIGQIQSEDKMGGAGASASLPSGQEAYKEMLQIMGTPEYERQEAATVQRVKQLAARCNTN